MRDVQLENAWRREDRRRRIWIAVLLSGAVLVFAALASTYGAARAEEGWVPLPPAPAAAPAAVSLAEPGAASPTGTDEEVPFRVNLNLASAEQLRSIPGIGPAKAAAILAYREKHRFHVTADLMRVRGIGPGTYRRLKPWLSVDGPAVTGIPPPRRNGT